MDIKAIFEKSENGSLTLEQFEAIAKEDGAKFTDLSEGKYVSKSKYDTDIKSRDEQITTLNGTIATRDTDLASIQKQLEGAGADSTKLKNVTADLTALQSKYDEDMKSYQSRLSAQAYEFAVKEYANGKKFSSSAAKRDFVKAMTDKGLTYEDNKILGADDFFTAYSNDNADAFVVESNETGTPHFVGSTTGSGKPEDKPSGFNFAFTGVRPH